MLVNFCAVKTQNKQIFWYFTASLDGKIIKPSFKPKFYNAQILIYFRRFFQTAITAQKCNEICKVLNRPNSAQSVKNEKLNCKATKTTLI
ncbi:MAG: hypothetical protein ACTTIM_04800 [Campylobacter sp.]